MMWIRQVEIKAGGKTIKNYGKDALEIDFNIPFSTEKDPDVSEITIYNLSNSTINDIKSAGNILVNAGYKDLGNLANILTGEIEDVIPEWQGVDKLTKILVSDGGKSWRNVELIKTYQLGTTASYIINDLASIMGYQVVAVNPVEEITYKRGKSIKGKVSKHLRQIVEDTKSKMFINKNRLVVRDEDIGYNIGFVLNSDSGLIGSPQRETEEVEKDGKKIKKTRWRIECLLNPLLEPDGLIKVESKVLNGTFRIVSGVHMGNFTTELLVE